MSGAADDLTAKTVADAADKDSEEHPHTERGTVLAGRYAIEALLGRGGMGAVYRAKDLELDELVALKMLKLGFDDPSVADRFRREVKLARRVTHRNVARTFDIGECGGARFLTMELVDGSSLASKLRAERPTLARAAAIITDLCAGLSAAHAAGVIHRDLKPENVLVANDGRIVITDFGIACGLANDGSQTRGAVLGTPAYMAPEQVEGSSDIDERADIYAVGEIFYEALTGERAWRGESIYKVAAAKLSEPPPDPTAKCDDLPVAISDIVKKCMARERESRFASAAELSRAIADALSSHEAAPLTVRTPSLVPAKRAPQKSVAVLPFKNDGPPDDAYIAAGLTEDIIDVLGGSADLRVRAAPPITRENEARSDPTIIGRALGVDVVVSGSVRRSGDGIRVSVRVVSAADGFQLWARRYDVSLSRVFSIGDEAGAAVGEAVTLEWNNAPRPSGADTDAVDLYLRARHAYNKLSGESVDVAIDLFQQALVRAPDDPKILAGLSMALTRRLFYDESENAADRALDTARRALALAPERVEARIAIAQVLFGMGSVVEAAREVSRARKITSENVDVMELSGRILSETGRVEEGMALLREVSICDPGRAALRFEVGKLHALLGNWAEAAEVYDTDTDWGANNLCWVARWRLVMWSRDAVRARALIPHAEAGTFQLREPALMVLALVCGDGPAAPILADIAERSRTDRARRRLALMHQLAAETHAFVADRVAMLSAIEAGEGTALFDLSWIDRCPLFDPYRTDSRFIAVRNRIADRAARVYAAFAE